MHGALGVTDDTILSYWYRHERAARIYDGADEVHKTTLGRRILQRHRVADLGPGSDDSIAGVMSVAAGVNA